MKTSNNSKELKNQIINIAIQEYLDTPEELRSLTKLSEKYGIRRQTISEHLKKRGYEVINYQNRARLNENAFDSMDTEEQFYWLGFLYADGNISTTGNRIEVRLSIKDLDHLEKFRKFIQLTTPIRTGMYNGNGFCHLSVRNKHMWNVLNDLGCVPCKSLILTFPNLKIFKNNKLNILHFIRGYVDGDGCLCLYKNKKNQYCTNVGLVGTKKFLISVKKLFGNKHGTIRNKTSRNWENKAYSLNFGGAIARKFARYLYQNAHIYLERKYNIYLKFCLLEEQSSKRKSSKIGELCDENTEVTSKITKGLEEPQSIVGEQI